MDALTLFISDAHLGAAERPREIERERALLRFLDWARGRAEHLYVLGDLFDFWFEYRSVVSRRAFPVVCALRALADSGTRVTLMGGNHDWWLGDFMQGEAGLQISRGPVVAEAQGRRLLLLHGDGLAGERDRKYRLLRAVIRAPLSERLFRLIHPDIAFALARRFSELSRSVEEAEREMLDPAFTRFVRGRLAAGFDGVLHGHHHKPQHTRLEGGDWLVLGDWFVHFTFAALQGGDLRLLSWAGEGPGQALECRREPPPHFGIEGSCVS